MSHTANSGMAAPRSVRFSAKADKLLEEVAAREGKTVSDVIRERVEPGLGETETAGEAILAAALPRQLRKDEASAAFRKAYQKRHA